MAQNGDKVSKEFFERIRLPDQDTQFESILSNGERLTTLPNISKALFIHHPNILSTQEFTQWWWQVLQECFIVVLEKKIEDKR